jgi:hypothetical protein
MAMFIGNIKVITSFNNVSGESEYTTEEHNIHTKENLIETINRIFHNFKVKYPKESLLKNYTHTIGPRGYYYQNFSVNGDRWSMNIKSDNISIKDHLRLLSIENMSTNEIHKLHIESKCNRYIQFLHNQGYSVVKSNT